MHVYVQVCAHNKHEEEVASLRIGNQLGKNDWLVSPRLPPFSTRPAWGLQEVSTMTYFAWVLGLYLMLGKQAPYQLSYLSRPLTRYFY